MYLKSDTQLSFPKLARLLCPGLIEDSLGWDYENVYEWMWLNLPEFDFVLNVSREHGDTGEHDGSNKKRSPATAGSTYINAWTEPNGDRVDELPDSLFHLIAKRLNVDVAIFVGTLNVDDKDGKPNRIVNSSRGNA